MRIAPNTAIRSEAPANPPAAAPDPAVGGRLPVIVIRFPATYAWLAMGIGALFFFLGLLFALINPHRQLGLGAFISSVSLAAIMGANYWRQHLHVVAQLTPGQLILRRDGTVNWDQIAAIESKEIHSSYRGVSNRSEFACIRLRCRLPSNGRLDGFFKRVKHAVTGYDIIVPGTDLSCGVDWFVAECRKRMAARADAAGTQP
jgi:hypothetical protein